MRGRGATLVAHRVQTTERTTRLPGTEPERQRIATRGAHLASAPERRGLSTTRRDPKHCRLRTAPVKSAAVAPLTAQNVFASVSTPKTNALQVIASKDAWIGEQSRWYERAAAAKAGPPPHRTAASASQAMHGKKPGSNGERNARGGCAEVTCRCLSAADKPRMAIPDQGLTSFTWIRHRRVLGPASAGPRESPAGRRPFARVPPAHRQRLVAVEAPRRRTVARLPRAKLRLGVLPLNSAVFV